MNKYGAVITFKEGTTPAEAVAALAKLADIIELPTFEYRDTGERQMTHFGEKRVTKLHTFTNESPRERVKALLHKFNPDHGGPVWYVP